MATKLFDDFFSKKVFENIEILEEAIERFKKDWRELKKNIKEGLNKQGMKVFDTKTISDLNATGFFSNEKPYLHVKLNETQHIYISMDTPALKDGFLEIGTTFKDRRKSKHEKKYNIKIEDNIESVVQNVCEKVIMLKKSNATDMK